MRTISIESFGETKNELNIVLLRLTNCNGMQVELLTFGATIRSIKVPDREGKLVDVVLGYDSVRDYERCGMSMGGTLGRVSGIIGGAKIAVASREYYLAQNFGSHHRNGGTRSPLSKKVWDYSLMEEGNGVIFSIRSHDGEEGYPGNLTAQLSVVLTDNNELLLQYSASTDKTTVVNLASNVLFNLNGEGCSYLDDHEFELHLPLQFEINEDSTPTGSFKPVPPECKESSSLTKRIQGLYCSDVTRTREPKMLKSIARVFSTQTGIDLRISSTQCCAQIDVGSELNFHRGKGGVLYERGSAFCVSCRDFEDAPNHAKFPAITLRPDQHYQHITIFNFSKIDDSRFSE